MTTSFKYNEIWDVPIDQEVYLPRGSRVLKVDINYESRIPFIHVMVDTTRMMVKRKIHLIAVGDTIPDGELNYIGSFHMYNGVVSGTVHVFDGGEWG